MKDNEIEIFDSYSTREELVSDLDRMLLLKDCINELKDNIELQDTRYCETVKKLKNEIAKIDKIVENKENKDLQLIKKGFEEEIEGHKTLLKYKRKFIKKELIQFQEIYNNLFSKSVIVRCKDLVEELEKLSGNDVFANVSMNIVSYKHSSLNKIIKEYKDKHYTVNMTISDKKNPDYLLEENKLLYSQSFFTDFREKQQDGKPLAMHLYPKYGFTREGKRYTCLEIDNKDDITLKFLLGNLIEEDNKYLKPVDLLREAIYNCKEKEHKKNIEKQKVKRI